MKRTHILRFAAAAAAASRPTTLMSGSSSGSRSAPLYVPLSQAAPPSDVEAAEADSAASAAAFVPPATSLLDGLLARLGFEPGSDEPPEWRPADEQSRAYCASCFAYCAAGGLLLLRPEPLERHMSFPWRPMGLMIFANGFFSYMADVECWGRPSSWKAVDRLVATTNTLLQFALVLLHLLGPMSFPRDMVSVFTVSLLVAVACKRRAALALQRRDRDAYLRWHTAWHVVLPAGAVIGQLLLEP